jgi:hypothetical protein
MDSNNRKPAFGVVSAKIGVFGRTGRTSGPGRFALRLAFEQRTVMLSSPDEKHFQ